MPNTTLPVCHYTAESAAIAIAQLKQSGRGEAVLVELSVFIDGPACCLDLQNQAAVFTLLNCVWRGPQGATVRDMMRGDE